MDVLGLTGKLVAGAVAGLGLIAGMYFAFKAWMRERDDANALKAAAKEDAQANKAEAKMLGAVKQAGEKARANDPYANL